MKKDNIIKTVFGAAICIFLVMMLGRPENGTEKKEEMTRYTATFLEVFDTRTEIIGYAKTEEEFNDQVNRLKDKLNYYHQLFDIYHSYEGINNVKTINENAGKEPVVVDEEMIRLLQISQDMYGRTNGQVNVAMGSVLSIWHEYRERGINNPEQARVPELRDLEEAALHTDIDHIRIDEKASTVYLEDPQMSLDVGGIGKGYAVQKTAEYAKELGMENLLISVGGNVCAVGEKPDGSLWKVGIQNPDMDSEQEYVDKVMIKDCSVVTSGDYQRYYMVDGVKYCHIIDPDTLMPADYFAAVTVLTEDSGEADALSTAVYNMPLEEGLDFVNATDGLEAMWVMKDGSIYYSEQFKMFQQEQ